MRSIEDNVFYDRSVSTNASTLADQYASGTAAKVWNSFIGDRNNRTRHYKDRLVALLRAQGCKKILDVATGTG
jgi:glycine N-methyltransferase